MPSGTIPACHPKVHPSIDSGKHGPRRRLLPDDRARRRPGAAAPHARGRGRDAVLRRAPRRRPRDLGPGRPPPRLRLGDPPHARAAPGRGRTHPARRRMRRDRGARHPLAQHRRHRRRAREPDRVRAARLRRDHRAALRQRPGASRQGHPAGADPVGAEEVEGQGVRARRRSRARAGVDRGLQPRLLRRQPRAVGPRRQRAAGDAGSRVRPRPRRTAGRRRAGGAAVPAPAGARHDARRRRHPHPRRPVRLRRHALRLPRPRGAAAASACAPSSTGTATRSTTSRSPPPIASRCARCSSTTCRGPFYHHRDMFRDALLELARELRLEPRHDLVERHQAMQWQTPGARLPAAPRRQVDARRAQPPRPPRRHGVEHRSGPPRAPARLRRHPRALPVAPLERGGEVVQARPGLLPSRARARRLRAGRRRSSSATRCSRTSPAPTRPACARS